MCEHCEDASCMFAVANCSCELYGVKSDNKTACPLVLTSEVWYNTSSRRWIQRVSVRRAWKSTRNVQPACISKGLLNDGADACCYCISSNYFCLMERLHEHLAIASAMTAFAVLTDVENRLSCRGMAFVCILWYTGIRSHLFLGRLLR